MFCSRLTNDQYVPEQEICNNNCNNQTHQSSLKCQNFIYLSLPFTPSHPSFVLFSRGHLERVYDEVLEVTEFNSHDLASLSLMDRPELGVTFTKLHCWRLTQYDRAVFLDADTLVRQNVDELFDREEISASPDAGWPDCFNSGVFVFTPSKDTYGVSCWIFNRLGQCQSFHLDGFLKEPDA